MNKVFLFIYALSFSSLNCSGQENTQDFDMTINFEPSFSKPSTLILNKSGGTTTLQLKVYESSNKQKISLEEKVNLKAEDVSQITSFLNKYEFKIKGIRDTISSERVLRNGDSTTVYKITLGSDGITVNGEMKQNGQVQKFAFWSPKKETENHRFVELLFIASNNSLKKKKAIKYIGALEHYFDEK